MDDSLKIRRALDNYNERNFKRDSVSLPNVLDIVKIDGHWVQVYSPFTGRVRFLENGFEAVINWSDYEMIKSFAGWPVYSIKKLERFTPEEILNIRWGSEQEMYPFLKEEVRVFGEYISKK